MSAKNAKDGQHFPHKIGDVVLVKWRDGKIYFAKIKTIEWSKKRCVVIFDDKSQDLARFSWIHDVNETTTDIICVKCKQDCSDKGNEIVLCDQCGYGYHQKCHETKILQRDLEDDSSWICYFCEQEMACPYVTNADALTQSLEDIDDQASKPEKFKSKKRKQSMKITMETNKKYCTGLLADSPTIEQSGEEEAIGEHYMGQRTPVSAKSHKTQSKRKSKPYKVEICSSISKEYFVDNEEDDSETPTSSRGRKIKRKTPLSQEAPDSFPKKYCNDPSTITESPSGVGIFSFEMPTEFHSNLHQLAMASQLVSQSPSGEIPHSVIKAIEHEQKNHQEHKSPVNSRDKPKSLVLSIPRSPLISISGKSTTTPAASSLTQQPSTPSCAPVPSPVIVSNPNGKTTPSEASAAATIVSAAVPVPQQVPGSPDSGESVFTYPTSANNSIDSVVTPQQKSTSPQLKSASPQQKSASPQQKSASPQQKSASPQRKSASPQLKSASTPTIVRVDSDGAVNSRGAPVITSNEAIIIEPHIVTASSIKPADTTPTSVRPMATPATPTRGHPIATPPMTVTQDVTFYECPPPVSMVTKPTSIQFVDKNGAASVRTTPLPPKFTEFASPAGATINSAVTTPTVTIASPIIVQNVSPSVVRAAPTPVASQPVYYVQINGGTPSQPVLVRPVRQQTQSPVVKVVDGPALNRTPSSSHSDQQAVNHVNNAKTQKPTSHHDNVKETHTVYFANQVKDMGSNISVKMGATYNMVSEYTLISKFEEAWNKLNELTAQWQQPKQPTVVTKKPSTVTKTVVQRPPVSSGRTDKVVMVAHQQQQQQQHYHHHHHHHHHQQQQQQQQQQHTPQQQTLTTPVQLVPISTPHHVTTPIVHGDVVNILPSPAHAPAHMISNPVVIPAVARTASDVSYYNIQQPKTHINPTVVPIHAHNKNKDEVYMVQVVKPIAPVMPVTQVMPVRTSEKRTAAQQCDVCSKKASFLCSGCQSAWYCGRNCQYNAWQEHSHRCNKRS